MRTAQRNHEQDVQAELPKLKADGVTHARGCHCPRCLGWPHPPSSEELRREAEADLARRREKRRVKALALALELAESDRQTAERLRRDAEALARLRHDPRLDALLSSRGKGRPPGEAIAEVERRFAAAQGSGWPPAPLRLVSPPGAPRRR